eukprot:1611813-Rhodomonas_salina.1
MLGLGPILLTASIMFFQKAHAALLPPPPPFSLSSLSLSLESGQGAAALCVQEGSRVVCCSAVCVLSGSRLRLLLTPSLTRHLSLPPPFFLPRIVNCFWRTGWKATRRLGDSETRSLAIDHAGCDACKSRPRQVGG